MIFRVVFTNLPSFHKFLVVGSAQVLRLLFLRQIWVVILFTWVDLVDFRDRRMWKLFEKLPGLLKNSYFVHRYRKSCVFETLSGKDGVCCVNACHPFPIKVGGRQTARGSRQVYSIFDLILTDVN